MARKKRVNYARLLFSILVLALLISLIIFGIRTILSATRMKYDDSILGSAYASAEMPIPTATPKPTPNPNAVTAKYDMQLVSIYNEPGKNVYLTFDDGPTTKITPQVLDILKEEGVHATFFVLGKNVEANPEVAKRVAEEGHAICNHTYNHDYKALYDGTEFFLADIRKTETIIKETVGEDAYVKVFRFPGGSFETSKDPQKEALKEIDHKFLDWNSLNGDAEAHNVPPAQLLTKTQKTVSGMHNAVILMHDAATKQTTVDALRDIIDWLKSEGYTFKTLKDIPLA